MNRAAAVRTMIPIYLALIAGVPLLLVAALFALAPSPVWRAVVLIAAAPVYGVAYVFIAGALSRLTIRAIVPGKYPRDLAHRVYGPRRLYALCWTAVYYCLPIYHVVLARPRLKRLTFRLFGYTGSVDFQTYPDTWLRDLPLLRIGEGAYLSNRATISPNMCLQNGKILIAPVTIGAGSMVGHGTLVAPGVTLGAGSEIGVAGAIGIGVRIGERTRIGHTVTLDHGSVIGSGCDVGTRAYIGQRAIVHDGVRVPPGAVIPAKAILRTQADVASVLTSRHMDPRNDSAGRLSPPSQGAVSDPEDLSGRMEAVS